MINAHSAQSSDEEQAIEREKSQIRGGMSGLVAGGIDPHITDKYKKPFTHNKSDE